MHDILRERLMRKIDSLPEQQVYQTLDYIEFLESKYGTDAGQETSGLRRFAEAMEDKLRKKSMSPAKVREAFQLLSAADRVLKNVSAAGRKLMEELTPGSEGAPGGDEPSPAEEISPGDEPAPMDELSPGDEPSPANESSPRTCSPQRPSPLRQTSSPQGKSPLRQTRAPWRMRSPKQMSCVLRMNSHRSMVCPRRMSPPRWMSSRSHHTGWPAPEGEEGTRGLTL